MADEIRMTTVGPDWRVDVRLEVTVTGSNVSRRSRRRREQIVEDTLDNWAAGIGKVIVEDTSERLRIARG